MKSVYVSPHPAFPSYGNRQCPFCSLTVAEYLNGRLYPLSSGGLEYIHDRCYRPSDPSTDFPLRIDLIRPPPHIHHGAHHSR